MVPRDNWTAPLGNIVGNRLYLLSQHLVLPCKGHLEQDLRVVRYPKEHQKLRMMFDFGHPKLDEIMFKEYYWFDFYRYAKYNVPPNIPEERGNYVTVSVFFMQAMEGIK